MFFQEDFQVEVDVGSSRSELPASCQVSDADHQCQVAERLVGSGMEFGDVADEAKEGACDSLIMCIVTTLNHGLRNGGGIGDVLRRVSSSVSI